MDSIPVNFSVFFSVLCYTYITSNICIQSLTPSRSPNSSNIYIYIYIPDGKTQQFSLYLTFITTETGIVYMYQKFHENFELTLYCIGYVTLNTVLSAFLSPFLLSHSINFDIKMHATTNFFFNCR